MRTLALIVFACGTGGGVHAAQGQVTATFEGGISAVRYDGFLTSAAAALTPAVQWQHPRGRGFLSARGTYLQFESGNRSLDGSANGSWFTPLAHHWRGELGVSVGASDYANIASFSHGAVEARIHLMDDVRGGWLGATVGRASFGAGARPVTVVAMGLWVFHGDVTLFASADRSLVGDTAYSDLRSTARWRRARMLLEGTVGARVWSRGGGRGAYGEGTATWTLGRRTALLVSAGRYPTDAVSGSIAGRYVTAALRLGAVSPRLRAPRALSINVHAGSSDDASSDRARLEIQSRSDDEVSLTVYAPGAAAVEISGDFTDWRPVQLSRQAVESDVWVGTFRIASGMHRINVRRDGGRWMAPAGTTRSNDDYDGEVGVFVLP